MKVMVTGATGFLGSELVELARQQPGKINFGSGSASTTAEVAVASERDRVRSIRVSKASRSAALI